MKELTVNIQDEYEGKVIYRTKLYTEEEYRQLEEENKKLREELRYYKGKCEFLNKVIVKYQEEK